jgi:MFS family permease
MKFLTSEKLKYFWKFLPFWLFLIFFKFSACLHFNLMSPYGERVLPIWIVGLVMGATSLLQLVLDVPTGFILDKYGYKKFLKITTVIFMIAVIFLLYRLNFWTYILTSFVSCFGWLFFSPGLNAYVISHAPKDKAGVFISLRDVSESVGVVLSSAFFVFTISLPVRVVAIVILVLLVITFITISLSPDDVGSVHSEKKLKTQITI